MASIPFAPKSAAFTKNLSILQIEDSQTDAELAMLELSKAGFDVSSDVVGTLADVSSRMSVRSYDVVLACHHLVGWDGTDALQIVRRHHPDIPFILMIRTLADDIAAECLKQGVSDVVLKDRLARLPFVIKRALEEKRLREERKLARQELGESEARYRKLVEASTDAIFVDCGGKLVFSNRATLKLFGAESSEQIIGKTVVDLVHPNHLPIIKKKIDIHYRLGVASDPLECVYIRLDGSLVDVEAVGIPITWQGSPAIEVVARDITERKQAQRKIAHLASFPELNPSAVFEVDLAGTITYVNPTALRIFPNLLESGLKHALLSDWPWIVEFLKAGDQRQLTRKVEVDGSLFLQTLHYTSELGVIRAYLTDATEREQAEKLRRANEKVILEWKHRLELAEQADLPIGLWEWNTDSDELVWSDEIYRQLGYTPAISRPTSENFLERVHPEDRSRVESAVQAVLSGNSQTYEVQFRILRPDGTVCWLDSRGVKVNNPSPRMIGITIDITRLRRSESDYRSMVDSAPYGIFRSTVAGQFLVVNPALVKMLGYDNADEVLALDIERDVFLIPGERAQLWSRFAAVDFIEDVEFDCKRKDGHIISVKLSALPMHKESGEIESYQGFVEDITDRKTLAQQFWRSQKMEAIGRLAGGVAHDFNNVLMIVGSYADLIQQREVSDPQVNLYAEQIRQSATRAVSITRQLLAFSRQQILDPEVLDINNVLSELSKVLPRLLGEDIEVVNALDPKIHRVKVDRGQMEQVIMNLAVNSRDAMPKGGRFEIKTENAELDAAFCAAHRPIIPGSYVKLTISDSGTGMSAETQSRIFEPFFTTKERGRGTGLGLATVYGIVKQSGGYIWVITEEGRGTMFEIYFPRVREPLARKQATHTIAPFSGVSATILLVEDEAALRNAICSFLQSNGYAVLAAGDGKEAIEIAEKHRGIIDIMLTDLVMPGMDGIEVVSAIAPLHPGMHIVYMSGYTERTVELLHAGAVLLKKPFSLSELAGQLRAVLGSS
jgi:PAS domain S-box-containing protein